MRVNLKKRERNFCLTYPGLVLKRGAQVAGLALALRDELLESQSVVLPQGEADIPQHQQHQFDVLLREGSDKTFEDVNDEDRMHHLEVIEVTHNSDQVVAFFAFGRVVVHFVELSHNRLEEISSNLEKSSKG